MRFYERWFYKKPVQPMKLHKFQPSKTDDFWDKPTFGGIFWPMYKCKKCGLNLIEGNHAGEKLNIPRLSDLKK